MIKKLAAAAVTAALVSFAGVAYADGFAAAPMNSGPPTNLPGQSFPVIHEVMGAANAVTQPIVQPILAPAGGMAAPAPMMRHRHRHAMHRMHRRHMAAH